MRTARDWLFIGALFAGSLSLASLLVSAPVNAQGAQNEAPQAAMAQFARGATSWADNCARCHNMRSPGELRDDQWRAVVAHMRVRAGLTGAEARDILAFLQGSN